MSSVSGLTDATGLSGDDDLAGATIDKKAKQIYEQRPEDEQQEIKKNIEEFQQANKEAEIELEKWDDSQVNDSSRFQNDKITLNTFKLCLIF